METFVAVLQTLRRWGQRIGPYAVIEIVMPGGTLIALMLFLYRRRMPGRAHALRGGLVRLSVD